ncbi:hypothetical protein C4K26_5466 [Pseudomonas chlororaphis]|nr:hypothetical protein C4K26_5466 [Pseudomonas chlororaphis]
MNVQDRVQGSRQGQGEVECPHGISAPGHRCWHCACFILHDRPATPGILHDPRG